MGEEYPIFDFYEIQWANKNLRTLPFGFRGYTFAYFNVKKFAIRVTTGNESEEDLRFLLGASWPGFGPRFRAVFAEQPFAEAGLNFGSMYLTHDGADPLAGMKSGDSRIPARVARENAALKPNTTYYLSVEILDPGAPGREYPFRVAYYGTDPKDAYIIADRLDVGELRTMSMKIEGVDGIWTETPKN